MIYELNFSKLRNFTSQILSDRASDWERSFEILLNRSRLETKVGATSTSKRTATGSYHSV